MKGAFVAKSATNPAFTDSSGRRSVRQPEVTKRIEEMGAEPIGNTPAEATAAYKTFLPISMELTRATGVTLD